MSDPYNEGYTHEALHASHIVLDMLDGHVIQSRCSSEFPDVRELADKAERALYDLYQLIGSKMS